MASRLMASLRTYNSSGSRFLLNQLIPFTGYNSILRPQNPRAKSLLPLPVASRSLSLFLSLWISLFGHMKAFLLIRILWLMNHELSIEPDLVHWNDYEFQKLKKNDLYEDQKQVRNSILTLNLFRLVFQRDCQTSFSYKEERFSI